MNRDPVSFVAISSAISAGEKSSSGPYRAVAALLMTAVTTPNSASTSVKNRSTESASVTSSSWGRHTPPACPTSAEVSDSLSIRRPPMATRQPSAANFVAIACPMPVPAPVTATTRARVASCSSAIVVLPQCSGLAPGTELGFDFGKVAFAVGGCPHGRSV